MLRLGAKPGTQNIDRILRLPDTINLPNAKKRKEGRTECPTKLLWFDNASYPLDAFPSAAPTPFERIETGISEAPGFEVAPGLEDLPLGNLAEGIKSRDETPSGYGFRFMLDCHANGMSYEQARAAILADKTTAGEWARRSDVDERQLKRAWENSKPADLPAADARQKLSSKIVLDPSNPMHAARTLVAIRSSLRLMVDSCTPCNFAISARVLWSR